MRMRQFTVLFLLVVVVTVLLLTQTRSTARDAQIPSSPSSTPTPETNVVRIGFVEEPGAVTPKVPTMFVNNRKIRLNYNVSEVGPSGVSAIELWATRDGRTWQRYSNEPPPAGPLVVHVAEEGRYGFTIVVRSGTGLASPAPQTGEAPQLWVVVDETKPVVKFQETPVVKYQEKGVELGTMLISWTASDVHLASQPISLQFSTSKEGPWTMIASDLENTGTYRWEMPKDVPYQFYLRLQGVDRAGNIGSALTAEPIKVDMNRPKGTILGVETEMPAATKAPPIEPLTGWIR